MLLSIPALHLRHENYETHETVNKSALRFHKTQGTHEICKAKLISYFTYRLAYSHVNEYV